MSLHASSSQTVGPFFSIGLSWLYKSELITADERYTAVTIEGRVLDGDGLPIQDAVLELWQADAEGRYAAANTGHPGAAEHAPDASPSDGLRGFGRVPTDERGAFRFQTVKPGRVPDPDGSWQAPHVNVIVFMRGLLKPVRTRLYFPDDADNARDSVLCSVPTERRATLIARGDGSVLRWDVIMQGPGETVFLEL